MPRWPRGRVWNCRPVSNKSSRKVLGAVPAEGWAGHPAVSDHGIFYPGLQGEGDVPQPALRTGSLCFLQKCISL